MEFPGCLVIFQILNELDEFACDNTYYRTRQTFVYTAVLTRSLRLSFLRHRRWRLVDTEAIAVIAARVAVTPARLSETVRLAIAPFWN